MTGLYLHIPFCAVKCGYCDFYSLPFNREEVDRYVTALKNRKELKNRCFDTVYFGGGTPSIIGGDRIADLLSHISDKKNAEITVECNPNVYHPDFFKQIQEAGVNRVSLGLQSANPAQLRFLGRKHSAKDFEQAVLAAFDSGIHNLSADIMLGLPEQTEKTLAETIAFCVSLPLTHISAYMLKIEPQTPFANLSKTLFPNDDRVADLYLFLCDALESAGFEQYEISNFAKPGFHSRHNLLYWKLEDYIGLGPAAHSFFNGKRMFFPRDIQYFINGGEMIEDEPADLLQEYIMLGLRLKEGIRLSECIKRGLKAPERFLDTCRKMEKHQLMQMQGDRIALTRKGFLVQNAILCDLL